MHIAPLHAFESYHCKDKDGHGYTSCSERDGQWQPYSHACPVAVTENPVETQPSWPYPSQKVDALPFGFSAIRPSGRERQQMSLIPSGLCSCENRSRNPAVLALC